MTGYALPAHMVNVQVSVRSLVQAPNQLVKIACASGAAVSVTCVP